MTVSFVPPREPLVDPRTGIVTRTWYLFFQRLFDFGGMDDDLLSQIAPTSGGDVLAADLDRRVQELSVAPPQTFTAIPDDPLAPFVDVDAIRAEAQRLAATLARALEVIEFLSAGPQIASLADQVTLLRAEIDDLKKGTIA